MSIKPRVLTPGTVLRIEVRTTDDVVSVVAAARGLSAALPQVGPGLFIMSTRLGPLRPTLHGSFPVTFVARDASGADAHGALSVSAP